MTDLPPGWEWATLAELASSVKNGIFVSRPGTTPDGVPILRISSVRAMRLHLDDIRYSGKQLDDLREQDVLLLPDDLLFARYSGSREFVGVCARVPDNVGVLTYPDKLIRVRVPILDSKYLAAAFASLKVRSAVEAILRTTAGQVGISGSALKGIRIPIAPLAEQRRIVAVLEDHLSRLEGGLSSVKRACQRTKHLRLAALRHYLRGVGIPADLSLGSADDVLLTARGEAGFELGGPEWTIPESWRWSSIGQLFRVFVGSTPKRSVDKFWRGSVPWVSSGEVSFRRIRETRELISDEALGNRATRYHPPGTVLLAMIGEGKTRGQAAILDIHAAHNQNCASIRVSETAMLPEYVYAVLEERYEDTRRSSSGGNQPALNSAKVKEIPVPVPPPATQRLIVDNLQELSENSDRLIRELRLAEVRAETLRRALLAEAFAGRLVPQDPNDEPASVLLERIRSERATQPKLTRTRRAKNTGQETLR